MYCTRISLGKGLGKRTRLRPTTSTVGIYFVATNREVLKLDAEEFIHLLFGPNVQSD